MIAWKASIALLLTLSQLGMVKSLCSAGACDRDCVNSYDPDTDDETCLPGGGGAEEFDLIAGQTEEAGTVSLDIDGDDLHVTFETTEGWCLLETHVEVFDCDILEGSSRDLPKPFKNGNPSPGQFQYQHQNLDCAENDQYTIDISGFVDSICVAAHAVVQSKTDEGVEETAWGGEKEFPGNNWATYMEPDFDEGPCVTGENLNFNKGGGIRYRNLDSSADAQQIYFGIGDLGKTPRAQDYYDFNQVACGERIHKFEFIFESDSGSYKMISRIKEEIDPTSSDATPSSPYEFTVADVTSKDTSDTDNVYALPDNWNAFEIIVTDRNSGNAGKVDLKNLVIDGVEFGNFCGDGTKSNTWIIKDLTNLSEGFTVTGDIVFTCDVFASSQELNKIDILAIQVIE